MSLGGAALAPAPWHWLAWWTALSCIAVAAAYGLNQPAVFGKRDGRIPWHRRLLLGPYLAAFAIACEIMRWARDAAPVDEIMPDLYVGGRIRPDDVPAGVELIIDLIAEFGAPAGIRARPGYRSLPVLDGGYPPDEDAFLTLLDEAAACTEPVLIHCDSGKGRAPTFAALVLIRRGLAEEPERAVELVREGRAGTAPTLSDMSFARRMLARMHREAAETRQSGADGGSNVRGGEAGLANSG